MHRQFKFFESWNTRAMILLSKSMIKEQSEATENMEVVLK